MCSTILCGTFTVRSLLYVTVHDKEYVIDRSLCKNGRLRFLTSWCQLNTATFLIIAPMMWQFFVKCHCLWAFPFFDTSFCFTHHHRSPSTSVSQHSRTLSLQQAAHEQQTKRQEGGKSTRVSIPVQQHQNNSSSKYTASQHHHRKPLRPQHTVNTTTIINRQQY